MERHITPEAVRHGRMKVARLPECGSTTIPLVTDDVRGLPVELVSRIRSRLG